MSANKYKIYIESDAWAKLQHWVHLAKGEVSGLGTVVPLPDGDPGQYLVDEVYLFEQTSSSSDTDLDQNAVATLMIQMEKEETGSSARLRFWWHSHGNMEAFWSQQDWNTLEILSKSAGNGPVFAAVFNKKARYEALVYSNANPEKLQPGFHLDSVFDVQRVTSSSARAAWTKEFEDKVTEERIGSPTGYFSGTGDDDDDETWAGYPVHTGPGFVVHDRRGWARGGSSTSPKGGAKGGNGNVTKMDPNDPKSFGVHLAPGLLVMAAYNLIKAGTVKPGDLHHAGIKKPIESGKDPGEVMNKVTVGQACRLYKRQQKAFSVEIAALLEEMGAQAPGGNHSGGRDSALPSGPSGEQAESTEAEGQDAPATVQALIDQFVKED